MGHPVRWGSPAAGGGLCLGVGQRVKHELSTHWMPGPRRDFTESPTNPAVIITTVCVQRTHFCDPAPLPSRPPPQLMTLMAG